MKIKEIISFLESVAPKELAEEWDNVGLQIGNSETNLSGVVVSLDFTEDVLNKAIENNCNLIVTHHPVIFKPIYSLCDTVILKAVQNNICVYSAHTNLDIAPDGVNDALAIRLGLTNVKSDGILRFGELETELSKDELIDIIKTKLNVSALRIAEINKKIKRVGVVGGSGGDFLELAISNDCDAFVTGEASYHLAQTAISNDILLICAGHYETEVLIAEHLKNILSKQFPELIILNGTNNNPFTIL